MKIKYTAWYRQLDSPKTLHAVHGELSDEEIVEAIEKSKNITTLAHREVELESVDYDSIEP